MGARSQSSRKARGIMMKKQWQDPSSIWKEASLSAHIEANHRWAIRVRKESWPLESLRRRKNLRTKKKPLLPNQIRPAVQGQGGMGNPLCAITDKLADDSEDGGTKRMLDAVKDREVMSPQRTKVRKVEEIPKGVRKAPHTNFPPTMRAGEVRVRVKVPSHRKQPPSIKHGVWLGFV